MKRGSAMTARLSCGCVMRFNPGVEGSPVTVVVDKKSEGCAISAHVAGLPVYDQNPAETWLQTLRAQSPFSSCDELFDSLRRISG